MNDSELEAKLRRVPAPARSEEYWEDFPRRMRVRSRLTRAREDYLRPRPRQSRLAWAGGFAVTLVAGWLVWHGGQKLAGAINYSVRKDIEHLPGNLKTFMQDEHGQHALVADPQP